MTSDEILISLRRVLRAVNIESKRYEKLYGLSIPQMLVLNFIAAQKDMRATNKAVTDHMKLNASTVTGILQRLHAKGLVARVPNASDQRGPLIAITEDGHDLIQSTPQPLQQKFAKGIESLNDEERKRLEGSLNFIVELLELDDMEPIPLMSGDPIDS